MNTNFRYPNIWDK